MCLIFFFFFLLFLVPLRTRAQGACLGVFFLFFFFYYFLLFSVVLYLKTHLHVSSFFFFFFSCCSLPQDTFRCLECFFFLVVLYLETHLRVSSVYFFFPFVVLDLKMHLCVLSVSFFFFVVLYLETHYASRVFLFSFFILFLTSRCIYSSQALSCYWPLFWTLSWDYVGCTSSSRCGWAKPCKSHPFFPPWHVTLKLYYFPCS